MRRRPIYRWRSFWLGVLVLGFLGSVWVRSMRGSDMIGYTTGMWSWEFGSFEGGVGALWGEYTFTGGPFEFSFGMLRSGTEPWFAKAIVFQQADHVTLAMGQFTVAWWLAMLVFAVGWVWFLVWRWRRALRGTPNIEHRTSNIEG